MTFNKSKLIKKIGIFLGIDLIKLRWILQGNPIRLLTKEFYLPIINLNMHPWGKIKKLQKILIKDPFSETNQAKLETVASGIDIDIPQVNPLAIFLIEDVDIITPVGGVVVDVEVKSINHPWFPTCFVVGVSKSFFSGGYDVYDFYRNTFARGLYDFQNFKEIYKFLKIKKKKINEPSLIIPIIKNYSHWIISYLPKVVKFYYLYSTSQIQELKNIKIKILIYKNVSNFQIETLNYFDIPFEIIDNFQVKTKKSILLETGFNDLMQVDDVLFIANKSKKKIHIENVKENFESYFLTRIDRKGTDRYSDLEDKLVSNLKNFKTINTSELGFKDQVNIFSQTKNLITWHGAGLANLIWMNKDSKVVEIFSDNHINHVFQTLSSIKRIDYLKINENDLKDNFEEVIIKINNFFG